MKTSAKIASIGFCNAMSSAYPGQNEQEIDAILESSFRLHGASMHAYPPVVAGGSNAITLHYISNNAAIGNAKSSVGSFQWSSCHHSREDFNCCKRISAGSKGTPYLIRGTNEHHNHVEHDLVLVDAGCEYGLYCSDITRCWPMSGQFTEEQSLVYEAVLTIQRKCIEALESKVVTSLHNLHQVVSNMYCLLTSSSLSEYIYLSFCKVMFVYTGIHANMCLSTWSVTIHIVCS